MPIQSWPSRVALNETQSRSDEAESTRRCCHQAALAGALMTQQERPMTQQEALMTQVAALTNQQETQWSGHQTLAVHTASRPVGQPRMRSLVLLPAPRLTHVNISAFEARG